MIRYFFQGEYHTLDTFDEFDPEGDYHLTGLLKKHNLPETKRPTKFIQNNNNPWKGRYHVVTHSRFCRGTYGVGELAVAYLEWLGAENISLNGELINTVKIERAEVAFGKKLMESLGKVYEVIPQFKVLGGKYRIDFYIPETKQAFEYDEPTSHRKQRDIELDAIRQHEIEEALGCTFIRIPH